MPPVGFEPAIPASERPQTHALEGAATRIGKYYEYDIQKTIYRKKKQFQALCHRAKKHGNNLFEILTTKCSKHNADNCVITPTVHYITLITTTYFMHVVIIR
jgi:bisphosphoglycerate-independent phosphoglycerate mutase (AlkP superfamily)